MYSLRISIGAALMLALMSAPFAFADDDDRGNSGNGKGNGKNDDKKSFVIPFTSLGTTTGALQAQIQSLQEMLRNLKAQREALDDDSDNNSATSTRADRSALKAEIKETKRELKFLRSLTRGMSGGDVRDLQEFLHAEGVYPEGVFSGFYGPLTEEAVKRFQEKHGIERAGVFGPQTRAKALGLFGGFFPAGLAQKFPIEFGSSTPTGPKVTICHKPAGVTPTTISVSIAAFAAHLIHGDSLGACDGGTGTTTPPTDTTAPIISALSITPASTTATVNWTTNESASSRVWYATSTPLTLASPTLSVFNGTLTLAHSPSLSGLTASTTYHVVVESKDAAGNTATSSSSSFVTTN